MNAQQAVDEISKVFNDAWTLAGYSNVAWDDLPAATPASEAVWARVSIQHATGTQGSLAGEQGVRRWDNRGVLIVQVFAPVGDGKKKVREAAQVVVNAYRGAKDGSVWFRNTRMNEIGASGAFNQINVITDFQYDDLR